MGSLEAKEMMHEPIQLDGYEIGYIERQSHDWMVTSRVDNERMRTPDRAAGIAWLKRIWAEYFARR